MVLDRECEWCNLDNVVKYCNKMRANAHISSK